MKVGDFVKGLPGSPYSITTESMTRGVVTDVRGEMITVKILDHANGNSGIFDVDHNFFEVIGHVKSFSRDEVLDLLKSGCKKAVLDYDLRRANLSDANLRRANLSDANLSGADLRRADLSDANLSDADLSDANLSDANLSGADLRRADLSDANLSDANLSGANLSGADLSGADLSDVDLDFSCWPLWCGGLKVKVDKRIACQLAYHLCAMQCDDKEYISMRNSILWFANQFHRVSECGSLCPINDDEE